MNSGLVLFVISIIWIASEILLVLFKRSDRNDENRDSGSVVWLNVVIYGSVALAVMTAFSGFGHIHSAQMALAWIGLFFILTGLVIRWTAILSLRQYFTVNVAIRSQHQIVRKGLYRFIRHPAYLGSLVSFLGLGLALSNWISFCLLLVFITMAFVRRIKLEEQVLTQAFGHDYEEYCRTTARLMPWLY